MREEFKCRRKNVEFKRSDNETCGIVVGRDVRVDQVLWRGSVWEIIREEKAGIGELVVERRDR